MHNKRWPNANKQGSQTSEVPGLRLIGVSLFVPFEEQDTGAEKINSLKYRGHQKYYYWTIYYTKIRVEEIHVLLIC